MAFITAGFPDLKTNEALIKTFEENGVDIIELGVPFSDPIADGPTIQYSSQYALDRGTTLEKILGLVKRIKNKTGIPILLMSYLNPIYKIGLKDAAKKFSDSGVDGVIIPDLIPEESGEISKAFKKHKIAEVFLAAPNTPSERIKFIDSKSRGFLYVVSLTGVTGKRSALPANTKDFLSNLKENAKRNLKFLGFGISSPEQARELKKYVDGIIVGSAIIELIRKFKGSERIQKIANFIKKLREALDAGR